MGCANALGEPLEICERQILMGSKASCKPAQSGRKSAGGRIRTRHESMHGIVTTQHCKNEVALVEGPVGKICGSEHGLELCVVKSAGNTGKQALDAFLRRCAQIGNEAALAFGPTRLADITAMQNEPMMGMALELGRDDFL